ncbi:hypothetical protein GE061_016175 [Apolygus lucorum]|uniref:Regulatory protein zeste n=1 Tax=Apolygus lucorum TaxID=248454 RepID=A0A8S9XFG6_APOLU|nr:hypothetical protein GE061_016175 [Apolygus lucorum]
MASKRMPPFSKEEHEFLKSAVAVHKEVIDDRSNTIVLQQRKAEAWVFIEEVFNSVPTHTQRTVKQLKKAYENMKNNQKAAHKQQLMLTGGGRKPKSPTLDPDLPREEVVQRFATEERETIDSNTVALAAGNNSENHVLIESQLTPLITIDVPGSNTEDEETPTTSDPLAPQLYLSPSITRTSNRKRGKCPRLVNSSRQRNRRQAFKKSDEYQIRCQRVRRQMKRDDELAKGSVSEVIIMDRKIPSSTQLSCPMNENELSELVKATTTLGEAVIGEWKAVCQGLASTQETIDQFNSPLEQDETPIQLPPGAAISIKDISERQARIAASAADVLANLDVQIPDFSECMKTLEARVEKLRQRKVEVDQRCKDLMRPIEKYLV